MELVHGFHVGRETRKLTSDLPSIRSGLRILVFGVGLFVYTWLGTIRGLPPVSLLIQGLVIVLMTVWGFWKFKTQQHLPRSLFALPLVAYLGTTAVATVFSVDVRVSLDGLLTTLSLVLFFFLICDLLIAGWRPRVFVDGLLLLATLLLIQGLWSIFQWYRGWFALRVPEYPMFLVPFRLYGVADHPNLLAGLLNMALPFAILKLFRSRRIQWQISWALWLLVAEIVLFFSRSRGGWIAASVVITITVGWLLINNCGMPGQNCSLREWLRRGRRIWITTLIYLSLFGLMLLFSSVTSPSEYSTNAGGLTAGRSTFWRVAWHDFLSDPLTGSGPLTYSRFYVNNAPSVRTWIANHAHNLYLNVLAEQGILGGVALAWLFIAGIRAFHRGWRRL